MEQRIIELERKVKELSKQLAAIEYAVIVVLLHDKKLQKDYAEIKSQKYHEIS